MPGGEREHADVGSWNLEVEHAVTLGQTARRSRIFPRSSAVGESKLVARLSPQSTVRPHSQPHPAIATSNEYCKANPTSILQCKLSHRLTSGLKDDPNLLTLDQA
jgi:hypothetical protein